MKLWFDTDPGVDDALALALIARSPSLNLVGVSTVFGNADVVAFVVTDADGTVRRVPALVHPGLPNYRFAVTMATPENGVLPVTCETLP